MLIYDVQVSSPAHFWMPILVQMTLEDVAKPLYFMAFLPKFHILATRGKKSGILTIFVYVSAILEDFLTEKEKNVKNEKNASC